MAEDEDSDQMAPLLVAAQRGDRSALNRVLRQLWPWIRRKAGSLVARKLAPLGVSSLTQETALRFSRSIEKAHAADSPTVKALLSRIMQNTARDAHRTNIRTKRDAARRLLVELLQEPSPAADETLALTERLHRLEQAIAWLKDRQRQAIELYLQELPVDEIAKELGCSVGAASMLINRAKVQLAELLKAEA